MRRCTMKRETVRRRFEVVFAAEPECRIETRSARRVGSQHELAEVGRCLLSQRFDQQAAHTPPAPGRQHVQVPEPSGSFPAAIMILIHTAHAVRSLPCPLCPG